MLRSAAYPHMCISGVIRLSLIHIYGAAVCWENDNKWFCAVYIYAADIITVVNLYLTDLNAYCVPAL